FAMFTPYAGIGHQWLSSDPKATTTLKEESFGQKKIFAGINVQFLLINLALEVDKTGDATSYSARAGVRF
ncbi:MAG: hypothetical protein GXP10_03970, partial [Gammaproteobacteria bacterium]|nr:hypothetical protein [Gammaproteobacteria bacterium]